MSDTSLAVRRVEREVTVLLHRVRRRAADQAQAVHPRLQPAAYALLLLVGEREPVRASELVECLGIDKGAVSRQVAHLEDLGLVRRGEDPTDRRAASLLLTPDARARIDRMVTDRRAEFAGRLAGWSATELDDLADQLARYNASLEE